MFTHHTLVESAAASANPAGVEHDPTASTSWRREAWAALWAIGTVVAVLPVMALAWLAMWQAQVRLTPNPEAELMAQLAALGPPGPTLDPEFYEYGRKVYLGTCIACHGADGRGIQGNGKDLVRSEFVRANDDDFLVAFLKKGRDLTDPLNTTKILMPPKGGNPVLNEDDLYDVVEYLRGMQDPRRIPAPGSVSPADASADADSAQASIAKSEASTP